MMNKAIDAIGPILNTITNMKDMSSSEKEQHWDELLSNCEQACYKLQAIDDKYSKIEALNESLEAKIKHMSEENDALMKTVRDIDKLASFGECQAILSDAWDKLDSYSKEYLMTANYLYRLFSKDNLNCSPAVLEFGRVLENEFGKKIYNDYISGLSMKTEPLTDSGKNFSDLKKCVREYRNKSGDFYLPARLMVHYLSLLPDDDIISDYKQELLTYLQAHNIDYTKITDEEFLNTSDELFDRFRNKSAHPGTYMDTALATECKSKTHEVLKHFMSAV